MMLADHVPLAQVPGQVAQVPPLSGAGSKMLSVPVPHFGFLCVPVAQAPGPNGACPIPYSY